MNSEEAHLLKNKILVSWSTGKDCAYALHHMRQLNNHEVVGLLTTITEDYDRVSMHSTRHELLKKQAEYLNLPIYPIFIPASCTNEIYEARMQHFINEAMNQGVTHIVFGDLFLEDVRRYREAKLATTTITPLFPLWGRNTATLANEMIDAGVKAVITCIDSKKLDATFVGRQFDKAFLNALPDGIDPCGENGEFHTFVYDGPMFERAISISMGEVVKRGDFIYVDVTTANPR